MTNYSDIYALFLASIKDYKIDRLYQISPEDAEEYMKPFLIKGLTNFSKCKVDLEDRDDEQQFFNKALTTTEKVILSNLMLVEWLTKEVNDVLQMKLHLQDNDFKTYSEAQNLREKSNHLVTTTETIEKQITKYGYENLNWDSWQ